FAVGSADFIIDGVGYGGTGSLTLRHVHVTGFGMKGGDGACGGGGGMGAGGAIYVGKLSNNTPTLTIENSTFENNSAVGGNGADYSAPSCIKYPGTSAEAGGGGGGLSGNGGGMVSSTGGAGGGGGSAGNGGLGDDGGGGGGGTVFN